MGIGPPRIDGPMPMFLISRRGMVRGNLRKGSNKQLDYTNYPRTALERGMIAVGNESSGYGVLVGFFFPSIEREWDKKKAKSRIETNSKDAASKRLM